MVKAIAKAHGKKVILIKGFGWLLKLLSYATGLVNKAFGNLTYDQNMSSYKVPYNKVTFDKSIERTEGI